MKKKKKTLKILSIIGSVFLAVFLLIHICVSFIIGVVKVYITRIIIAVFAILCIVMVALSGTSGGDKIKFYESGYYIYKISEDGVYAQIVGLTDEGREQEYLIIPEKIDDIEVKSIGVQYISEISTVGKYFGNEKCAQFQSEKLKKVFIISDIEIYIARTYLGWQHIFEGSTFFEGILYISNNDMDITTFYVNDELSRRYYRTSFIGKTHYANHSDSAANVSYYYNYENSPNEGYYWIDNYAYGNGIEYIPENPVRDGYTFDGWYKEAECINEWDFEMDTLPQSIYDDYGNELYQETKLYAKWINN